MEPAAEVRLFALTLGMMEAAEGYDAIADESGIGGEDHVGRAGLWFYEKHVRDPGERGVQLLPLRGGMLAGGAMDVAGHPGVDDVIYVVERWRTHEKCGPLICRF